MVTLIFKDSCKLRPVHIQRQPLIVARSTAYFGIALSLAIYFGWKIFKRTSARKPIEMDLTGGLEAIDEDEQWWKDNYTPPTTLWGKFVDWLL